ncbi:hypothetical protein KTR9_0766 [Gordonia sp. KTR9]|nr:hypothetical protein KTR9_0766 [Gordonia sp. KTR9]
MTRPADFLLRRPDPDSVAATAVMVDSYPCPLALASGPCPRVCRSASGPSSSSCAPRWS